MPTPTGQGPEHPELLGNRPQNGACPGEETGDCSDASGADAALCGLSSMVATLCCYEERFGPYHPITLRLMTDVAIQSRHQALLERSIRDVQRFLGRTHELRLRAIVSLRNLLIAQKDFTGAAALQRELLECQVERNGSNHPETAASRTELEALLLKIVESVTPANKEEPRPRRVAVMA